MKVKRRTPTGKNVMHKRKERPAKAKCANCGSLLHGTPRFVQNNIGKLSKSEKRPNRSYGGYLCSKCGRELLRERARSI